MSELDLQFLQWRTGDGAGYLTLKRPPLNVVNIAMLREMISALEAAAQDSTMRVLVLNA